LIRNYNQSILQYRLEYNDSYRKLCSIIQHMHTYGSTDMQSCCYTDLNNAGGSSTNNCTVSLDLDLEGGAREDGTELRKSLTDLSKSELSSYSETELSDPNTDLSRSIYVMVKVVQKLVVTRQTWARSRPVVSPQNSLHVYYYDVLSIHL